MFHVGKAMVALAFAEESHGEHSNMDFRSVDRRMPHHQHSIEHPSKIVFDPLEPDEEGDRLVQTTERRLTRMAMIACDTGARFARDQIDYDPAAWMLSPRRLFGGERAIDACQNLEPFVQGIMLHGLSMDLDADPDEILAIAESGSDEAYTGSRSKFRQRRRRAPSLRLYSCIVEGSEGFGRHVQAFCAIVAPNEGIVRDRLRRRFGEALARDAAVRRGFDGSEALASVLLSDAVHEVLRGMASDPRCKSGDMSDLYVEQRFTAAGRSH